MAAETGELLKSVILAGMKHTGKTSLGKMLSRHFKVRFIDSDDVIEVLYSERNERKTCRQIFREAGREGFLLLEAEALERIAGALKTGVFIAALGGGAAENAEAAGKLSMAGVFVHLIESPEILYKRITGSGLPPFLDPVDPEKSFNDLWKRRTAVYSRLADISIELSGADKEAAFSLLLLRLKEAGCVR